MLVALLSSQNSFPAEGSGEIEQFRSAARIGGKSVLSRQVDFALDRGCERIICLTQGLTPELVEVQHCVENAGAVFHAIRTAINLSGLISVADDVLVIADGLLFDEAIGAAHIGPHRTVLTLPADPAVQAGYERVDQARAWAGMMVIPGALVEKFAELPNDVDPQSSLLRLALQNGIRCTPLKPEVLSNQQWALVTSSNIARAYEDRWLSLHTRKAPAFAPTHILADWAARLTAQKHPKVGLAAISAHCMAIALLAGGGLAGYAGYAAVGFLLAVIGAFSMRFAGSLRYLLDRGSAARSGLLASVLSMLLDLVIIFLCAVAVPSYQQIGTVFAATMLLGLLRVTEFTAGGEWWQKWQALAADRGMLALILLGAFFFDAVLPFLQLFAAAILAALLLQKFRARLTPT